MIRHMVLAVVACAATFVASAQEKPPVIAAASDLQFALTTLASDFEKDTGRKVSLTFGSSGNFARQIPQGAPFEMFLSADEDFVYKLADGGFTRDRGTLYAIGRIVLYVPSGSTIQLDPELKGLRAALPQIQRFSIANPEHAPYGRAAREALQKLRLWEALQPKLVLGENVSQATQYVTTGSAQAGIIAYSLAIAQELERRGTHVLLPESLHQQLRQRMVLLKNAGATAEAFYTYVQQPKGQEVLRRYGFVLPQQ